VETAFSLGILFFAGAHPSPGPAGGPVYDQPFSRTRCGRPLPEGHVAHHPPGVDLFLERVNNPFWAMRVPAQAGKLNRQPYDGPSFIHLLFTFR
jgi:hypothetical protein